MPTFSTPAIVLRRSAYGDFDLIVTALSLSIGKITVMAKNARKSRKRFPGALELFSLVLMECREARQGGMAVLQEAMLENPFSGIRGHVIKTAYASFWAELIHVWLEEGKAQTGIYHLLCHCLEALDVGAISSEELSILFQLRFLGYSGLSPNLSHCQQCHVTLDDAKGSTLFFELAKGGILCQECFSNRPSSVPLAKGTLKQLLWIQGNDLRTAARLKFSPGALMDGLQFLEKFVAFHVGKEPKSLKFLRNLRSEKL